MSFAMNAVEAVDADAVTPYVPASGGAGRGNYSRTRRRTLTTGATNIEARYRITAAPGGHSL